MSDSALIVCAIFMYILSNPPHMDVKTNPMRHLEKLGIPYRVHTYGDVALSGTEVAEPSEFAAT